MASYYKPPKTPKEQVAHLKKTKNIVFHEIGEEEAGEILKIYNYINVITPFKHHFYLKDKKGTPDIDEFGCHKYPDSVDFKRYYELYTEERNSYPAISANLIRFETIFNSLLSLQILNSNKFSVDDEVESFLEDVYQSLQEKYPKRANHYRRTIDTLKETHKKYHDIYCFFDSLTLGQAVMLYLGLNKSQQELLLKEFKKNNISFGSTNPKDFGNVLFKLVNIRNCIDHCNSLEVLLYFYNRNTGELRNATERSRYLSLIDKLKEKPCD